MNYLGEGFTFSNGTIRHVAPLDSAPAWSYPFTVSSVPAFKAIDIVALKSSASVLPNVERAIRRYVSEEISLGKAAELSELTYDKMLEEVRHRCLVLSFGPQDLHEAQEEEKVLETYLKIRSREEARR